MKTVLAVAVVLLVASSGFASITMSTVAPTGEDVVISQPVQNGASAPFYTSDTHRNAIGQSFSLLAGESPFVMDEITLKFRVRQDVQMSNSPWVVNFYTMANDSSGVTSSTIFSTSVGNMPTIAPAATFVDYYVTFDVPDTQINAGVQYGFVVDFASAAETHQITGLGTGWRISTGDNRAGGVGLQFTDSNPAGTLGGSGSDDIAFWITQQVPEPATMSLLAMGGLAALIRRKK